MKFPKLKLSTLIIFACGFTFMAYFGLWALMAVIFGTLALARVCGAILGFSGRLLSGVWRISNSKAPFSDPFFQQDVKKMFK